MKHIHHCFSYLSKDIMWPESAVSNYKDPLSFFSLFPIQGHFLLIFYRRSTRNIVEDYGFLFSQLIQASAMSVVVGLVYFNLGFDQSAMRDRFGMMYILGALYPYMIVLDLIGICKYRD